MGGGRFSTASGSLDRHLRCESLKQRTLLTDLLLNGSFESPVVTNPQKYDQLVPDGWSNSIEIQRGVPKLGSAAVGEQHIELDSTGSTSIERPVSGLKRGTNYTLSYSTRQRPNTLGPQDKENWVKAEVTGATVPTFDEFPAASDSVWTTRSINFATPSGYGTTSVSIKFSDSGPQHGGTSDSFGGFLDDVKLTEVPPKISWVNGATWSLLEEPWSDRLFGTNSINVGTTSAGYSVDLAGSESAGFYLAYLSPGEYELKFGGTLDYKMELPDYERKFDIVLTSGSTEIDRKQIVVSIGDVSTFRARS